MSAGGDNGSASANVGSSAGHGNSLPVYHRGETSTQSAATAKLQEQSKEIWGQPMRGGGNIPCVKAYIGHLPAGWRGIEFTTPIAPCPQHCTPGIEARWYYGWCPGVTLNSAGYAVIPVSTFKNMQP